MKKIVLFAFLALFVSNAALADGVECDVKAGIIKSAKNDSGRYTTLITVTEIGSARYAKMPCPVQKGQPPYQDLIELDQHYMPGARLDLTVEYFPVQTKEGQSAIGKWKVKK